MKVIKVAAIVVGVVALAATGIGLAMGAGTLAAAFGAGLGAIGLGSVVGAVGLGTLGTIALGALAIDLSMIAGALAPKPSAGGNQTKWKADPYAGIPYVMGRTLVGGNLVLKRGHGTKYKWLTAVTVLGLGPFQSIDAAFMDKAAVSFNGSGAAIGSYSGQIWQRTQLGACPEAVALSSPRGNPPGWTSAHKLSGLAAVINTFEYDGKNENGLTSVPPPSWIVKGALVYDPRLDSTYPGGSGACRAWNEATYVWSENPHLHGLTWALGRYQNGVRVAGIGAGTPVPGGPVKGIDVASFVEGANLDDARGWKLGGQVYTRPDTPWNSLKAMLQAGGARPVLVGGVISCINSAPKVSLATITRDDIAGATEFTGTQRRRQRINAIIPQYRSEQHDWEMVSAKRVSVAAFEALDGDERTREIAWPLVQQATQVSQLAALAIYELREAGPGTVPLKPWWLNYRIGDCVTFAPEDGFALKCSITGRGLDAQTGAVSVTLRGETDGKHDYALGLTGTAPPIASLNYVETVDAPTPAEWSLTDTELSANGTTVPALIVTGACDNPAAEAVIVEYRLYSAGQAEGAGWLGASTEAPTLTRKEISSVTTGTAYEVAVRYRVRGKLGPRVILGPETTAGLIAPGTEGPEGPQGPAGPAGPQGPQGIPGPIGPNGEPTYIWIAYANSPDGTVDFTNGSPGSRTYLGVAPNKSTQTESSNPGDYSWSRIEGPQGPTGATGGQGPQGIQGPAGPNGEPTYIWIAYSDSADGTVNFTNGTPGSRAYLGVAPNKFTQTESSNPGDYNWSKIEGPQGPTGSTGATGATGGQGPQGIQGPAGPNGEPTYIWIAYADSADGTVNFTNGAPGARAYIGVAANKLTQTESSNAADYAWSLIRGADGYTISPPSVSQNVAANSAGVVNTGELPVEVIFTVKRGPTDISTAATTTYAASVAGGTGSMGGVNNRKLSVSTMSADKTVATVSIYDDGVLIAQPEVTVLKARSGSAASSASTNSILGASNTTYGPVNAGPLAVQSGSGGSISAYASFSFSTNAGTVTCYGKAQYRSSSDGGSTWSSWTDMGSETVSDSPATYLADPGSFSLNAQIANSGGAKLYQTRLLLRKQGLGDVIIGSGSFAMEWS